jgi:hypothetical protein
MLGQATSNLDSQDSPRPKLGKSHHLPFYSVLCGCPHNPHPNDLGVPKLSKLGFPQVWGLKTLCEKLGFRWGLKQSCSPCWELSNDMLFVTCTQRNQVDSWLLVVGSQIANLTFDPSFGHNLCFRCSNGQCEPNLDIYVPRFFQWYEEIFNPLSFDPCNYLLKIWESIRTLTPKVGVALVVWGFIPSHFSHSGKSQCDSWASLLARNLASLLLWSRAQD